MKKLSLKFLIALSIVLVTVNASGVVGASACDQTTVTEPNVPIMVNFAGGGGAGSF